MKTIYVKDFTEFPGPRYISLGPNSGEEFRLKYLIPAINEYGSSIAVDLDGTMGYGSSFLEESFGGLVREGVSDSIVIEMLDKIISTEDPSLLEEISTYIHDAIKSKNS